MDDRPRQTLRMLIERHGQALCDNPRRCEALLRDFCGEYRREIFILVSALKEQVASELLTMQGTAPNSVLLARLQKRLQDQLGLAATSARWAVESWALALGVTIVPNPPETTATPTAAEPPAALKPPPRKPRARAARSPAATVGNVASAGVIDIRGWPEQRVRALQHQTATRLKIPVTFRDTFRDPPDTAVTAGPELVVIPSGGFAMGSPHREAERHHNEQQQLIAITEPFAIGKYPVLFEEFDAYIKAKARAAGFIKKFFVAGPKDWGWGRGRRPVIMVNWTEANDYAEWLCEQTGRIYRLPTEAEWEYAARAGTLTPFYFGQTIGPDLANYNAQHSYGGGPVGEYRQQTLEAGSFPGNAWGLHDMHGNVWEWTGSAYHRHFDGAEQRTARHSGGRRAARGGSWDDRPSSLRSARRNRFNIEDRFGTLGFRIVRQLS